MAIKKRLKNPLFQQYLLEIALPLVGYFVFDWSMAIIAAFYLIDFLNSEIARNRRVYKVYKTTKNAKPNALVLSVVLGGHFFTFSVIWTLFHLQFIYSDQPSLMSEELKAFAKEELWLLAPVVYLVYHFRDIFTFYMPRRFLNYNYQKMVKFQMLELVILIALIAIGVWSWNNFGLGDVVVLLGFIIIKVGFDFLVARTLDVKYKNQSPNKAVH